MSPLSRFILSSLVAFSFDESQRNEVSSFSTPRRSSLKNSNGSLARFFLEIIVSRCFSYVSCVILYASFSRDFPWDSIQGKRRGGEKEKTTTTTTTTRERAKETLKKKQKGYRKSRRRETRRKPRKRKKDTAPSLAIGHPFRSTWNRDLRSTEKFNKAHAPYWQYPTFSLPLLCLDFNYFNLNLRLSCHTDSRQRITARWSNSVHCVALRADRNRKKLRSRKRKGREK